MDIQTVWVKRKDFYIVMRVPYGNLEKAFILKEPELTVNKVFSSPEDAYIFAKDYNRVYEDSLEHYHILKILKEEL